jgi:sulfide:quinone oxidoreductase
MVANRIARRLPAGWSTTVVDPAGTHLYQPGLLFLPFGARDEARMVRSRARTLPAGAAWVRAEAEAIDTDRRRVVLRGAEDIPYDLLVVATGSDIRPGETEGMLGGEWRRSIHDFYTLEGAQALRGALAEFQGGRLVVNIVEMPIKCPVAPMEFLFLADDFFRRRGIRDRVELVFATPLDGAFTKPTCNRVLGHLIAEKGISLVTEFNTGRVDSQGRTLESFDGREVPYDLLVTIPVHGGAPVVEASGLGNELGFIPTHPATLRARSHDNVFVIGDATDVPASKAGSVAHFEAEVVEENLLRAMDGRSLDEGFDGHANCFIETGGGKALLIDFSYDVEPLPGKYPVPIIGPMSLLKPTRLNHAGKLAFRWVYWNLLLPGRPLPISNRYSLAGKIFAPPARSSQEAEP